MAEVLPEILLGVSFTIAIIVVILTWILAKSFLAINVIKSSSDVIISTFTKTNQRKNYRKSFIRFQKEIFIRRR